MGCPTTPLSCLDPSVIFAGIYSPACGGFADPSNFQAERLVFDNGYGELINNFGVEIGYYINTFNLSAANILYGEQPLNEYYGPVSIKAYIELVEPSPMYTLAGFDSSDTITAFIHIKTFTTVFSAMSAIIANGQYIEPKADDKMILYPLGCDRTSGRGAKIFTVTDVTDQDVAMLNPLMGHYIWRLKGVRSEHNFETNEPRENMNNQVYDNTFAGKLSSSMYPELSSEGKRYPFDIDTISQDEVFDQSVNNTGIYGQYY